MPPESLGNESASRFSLLDCCCVRSVLIASGPQIHKTAVHYNAMLRDIQYSFEVPLEAISRLTHLVRY